MGWITVKNRNPTKRGYYRVMVDGFPGNDFEDKSLNLFDGTDWDHMESCRQHITKWWEDKPVKEHTKGEWSVNETGKTILSEVQSEVNSGFQSMFHSPIKLICSVRLPEDAARIVKCVNDHDVLIGLLAELVHMQRDPTYGDLVWRLCVLEKSEELISNL